MWVFDGFLLSARLISAGVASMSSAIASATEPVFAHTEQPAPVAKSASENPAIPDGMWIVLILSLILLVLLAWRAIDDMVDGSGGSDNGGNWLPPL